MSHRVGIIGCGWWGQNYIRVFSELSQSELVGICDAEPSRLQEVGRRHPHVPLYDDYRDLLDQSGAESVVIAAPVSRQYELVRAALERGRHVLAEKPFVLRSDLGGELVALAEQQRLTLMVGYLFLHNPAVIKLKEYLTTGDDGIGEVYYLSATRTNLGPVREDVNVAWDLACHDIAIFSYLLDAKPRTVRATGSRFLGSEMEDVCFIDLEYPQKLIGHIHVCWADPNRVRNVVVVGSRLRISFDDLNPQERLKVYQKSLFLSDEITNNFGEFMLTTRDGDIFSPRLDAKEPLKAQCEEFLSCIENGRSSVTDGRLAVDVIRVLEAVQTSLAQDGQAVEIAC